jgi:hypothetical protein
MRRIARDIMPIPVTTMASKSVFSTGGKVISPHRSRLAPKTIEGLMCMQAWSRADMLDDQTCFMNALLTCLDNEEEEMVTRTHSLSAYVHTSLSSLFFNIALPNFSIFLFLG